MKKLMKRLFGIDQRAPQVTLQSEVAAHVRQNKDMEEINRRIARVREELALRDRRQQPRQVHQE